MAEDSRFDSPIAPKSLASYVGDYAVNTYCGEQEIAGGELLIGTGKSSSGSAPNLCCER